MTYNITEPFAVTVGARRYHYNAPVSLDQYGALTPTVVTQTAEKDQGVTPKVSLSYQFDKDLLRLCDGGEGLPSRRRHGPGADLGAGHRAKRSCRRSTAATGLRQRADLVQAPTASGATSSARNGARPTIASPSTRSAYFENWSRCAADQLLSHCGYVYTANAGDAHVYGGELEMHAIVVRDLEASANVTYSHAALVSSTLIDAGFNPGTPIQQVPQWTSTVAVAYRHKLTDEFALTARAESTYVGSRTDETYSHQ